VTRDDIVAEALRIFDDEGREALTMRRLASSLGIEAPSLYAHIRSKDELVDAVLDGVLDSVPLPPGGPDFRASLLGGFREYRRALLRHPAVVLLMTERATRSDAQTRLARRAIELLEAAGLSTREAVDAQVTLVAFVLGFTLQEVSRPVRPPSGQPPDPVMTRALRALAERSVDERFDVGLGLILDGAGVRR
jgi:AcrR family transcriptional regulator